MDTTRIASGDPEMWLDIMRMNRRPLLSAIKKLTTVLGQAGAALRAGDDEGLLALLREAKQRRDKWISERLGGKGL
jgi:prephenate dehydrogenase